MQIGQSTKRLIDHTTYEFRSSPLDGTYTDKQNSSAQLTRVKKILEQVHEHDFFRDLNFALFPLVLRSREEEGAKFKFRKKSCS